MLQPLLRPGRFDRRVNISIPDIKGREEILKVHAKGKPLDKNIDMKTIARISSGFTGAEIENLLNEAAILTAKENRKIITEEDIQKSMMKVTLGPQKKSRVIAENEKYSTAIHEAGHTFINKLAEVPTPVQEVSIIPRGMAAGYTISRPDNDESHMSYNKLIDTVTMMLGGRVAEEMFIKDVSTGASNDIERATKIVRKMVTEWGMSANLGPINYGSSNEVFLGRDYQTKISYSEKTASEIDNEIREIFNKCYSKAKEIIGSHLK